MENTPNQDKLACYLDGMKSSAPSSTIPESMMQDKRVIKDMYILSAKQSQAVADFRNKHTISDEDHKLVLSQLKMIDVWNNTPTTYETSLSPSTASPYEFLEIAPTEEVSTKKFSSGTGHLLTSEQQQPQPSPLQPPQQPLSPQFSVVNSPVQPDASNPQDGVNINSSISTEEDSADLCRVCFDAKINCVIVPCGHFSICMKCAMLVSMCPVCRGKIEQRQLVYRA